MNFQTEYEFELPRGYMDQSGEIHKKGVMRLATASDEIMPLRIRAFSKTPVILRSSCFRGS